MPSSSKGWGWQGEGGGAKFDVVTAVRVLKSAGHADHAAELARRHGEHDLYLRIQLERPQPELQGALEYIASLPFEEAAEQLRRRGKPLVLRLPEDTTGVLMALCTGKYTKSSSPSRSRARAGERAGAREGGDTAAPDPRLKSCPEDFIHLYVDQARWLRIFLQHVLREEGGAGATVSNTLLELLLREWSQAGEGAGGERAEVEQKQREGEVLALLDNPRAAYDVDHALVLVQLMNFKPGQLYLYEKLHMTDLVLEHYVEAGDTRNMVRMCRKEGRKNPDLWEQVLGYLVDRSARSSSGTDGPVGSTKNGVGGGAGRRGEGEDEGLSSDEGGEGAWDDILELLALIEREQALLPLQVVRILSRNPSLPLWVVRDHLSRHLGEAVSSASVDTAAIQDLRDSTGEMKAEIQSLRSVKEGSAVASSGAGLRVAVELPMFFKAGQRHGLAKGNTGGGYDLPGMGVGIGGGGEQRKIEDIKLAQARKAGDHEQFFKGLEEASDGFAYVASYFGKGVIH
ncbi:unnamed protein product [Discosporangium mesarthrocarpum]